MTVYIEILFVKFVGSQRGTYVESYSGKNTKYDKEIRVSELSEENRIKYLAAMRGRKFRQRRKLSRRYKLCRIRYLNYNLHTADFVTHLFLFFFLNINLVKKRRRTSWKMIIL